LSSSEAGIFAKHAQTPKTVKNSRFQAKKRGFTFDRFDISFTFLLHFFDASGNPMDRASDLSQT
jgi:hypothetical protein